MSLKKIADIIKKNKTFILSTHVNPDPDALCSELAMAVYLKSLNKKVYVINEEAIPKRFSFLPCSRLIKPLPKKKSIQYDVAIVVDCGDLKRIGKVQQLLKPEKKIINIDHHITNDSFGDVNFIQPEASSTAEMIFNFFKEVKYRLNREVSILLYLGIMTDTGSFRYDNTTPNTHRAISELMRFKFSVSELYKKLYEQVPFNDMKVFTKIVSNLELLYHGQVVCVELRKSLVDKFSEEFDLREKIFTFLRSIKGVEALIILTEESRSLTRVNFRSQGKVNVAKLAHSFNGGGHKKASGCTIEGNLKKAKKQILNQLKKVL